MSYSLIDLSENAQDNRYPITNDFGLLYHKAGRAAVDDICPYRIAVLWESPISETLSIKNNLELFLQGTCKSLSSKNQVLEDVIIKKCSFLEEYKFVFDKINKYLWNNNV